MQHKMRTKDIINLAAPHTWAASVLPSILALVVSYKIQNEIEPVTAICLLLVAVLMQSAVNAFNDYADYVKGTDTIDNSPDASDAVIVYGLNPKTARNLGITFLSVAFAIGLYTVYLCGPLLLVIGFIGALVIVTYSFGKLPISYLPIGELCSGFVMGGLIPLAGCYMQLKKFDLSVLITAIPIIIGIAMIMFSNNGCDIERDTVAGRRTFPCMIGRKKTDTLYRILLIVWLFSPLIPFAVNMSLRSILIYMLEVPVIASGFARQYGLQLGEKMRSAVMGGINNLVISLGFAYMTAYMFM